MTTHVVTTWPELNREAAALLDFHRVAVSALEAICAAVRLKDPVALRLAIREYGDLDAPEPFKVDKHLFNQVN